MTPVQDSELYSKVLAWLNLSTLPTALTSVGFQTRGNAVIVNFPEHRYLVVEIKERCPCKTDGKKNLYDTAGFTFTYDWIKERLVDEFMFNQAVFNCIQEWGVNHFKEDEEAEENPTDGVDYVSLLFEKTRNLASGFVQHEVNRSALALTKYIDYHQKKEVNENQT